jgi:hypothetical protein
MSSQTTRTPSEEDLRELLALGQMADTQANRAAIGLLLEEADELVTERSRRCPRAELAAVEAATQQLLQALQGVPDFFYWFGWDYGWVGGEKTPQQRRPGEDDDPAVDLVIAMEDAIHGPRLTEKDVVQLLRDIRVAAKGSAEVPAEDGRPPSGNNAAVQCAAQLLLRVSPTFKFSQTPSGAFGTFAKRFFEIATNKRLQSSSHTSAASRSGSGTTRSIGPTWPRTTISNGGTKATSLGTSIGASRT